MVSSIIQQEEGDGSKKIVEEIVILAICNFFMRVHDNLLYDPSNNKYISKKYGVEFFSQSTVE